MERTLIIIKPDGVQRGIIGEIISRFERVGLKLVAAKMVWPNRDHYLEHYEGIGNMISRRGQKAFDVTIELMGQTPVMAIVLEGVESVSLVRKMVGTTEPKSADPGTVRGDYAHVSFGHADKHDMGVANLIHASGDVAEAKQEIMHWFKDEELFEYSTVYQPLTQPVKKK